MSNWHRYIELSDEISIPIYWGYLSLRCVYLDNALRTDPTGQRDQSRRGAALSACSGERISTMMRPAITASRTLLTLEPDAG